MAQDTIDWIIANWGIILGALATLAAVVKTVKTTLTAGFELLGKVFVKKEKEKEEGATTNNIAMQSQNIQNRIDDLRIKAIAMKHDGDVVIEIERQILEQTNKLNQL